MLCATVWQNSALNCVSVRAHSYFSLGHICLVIKANKLFFLNFTLKRRKLHLQLNAYLCSERKGETHNVLQTDILIFPCSFLARVPPNGFEHYKVTLSEKYHFPSSQNSSVSILMKYSATQMMSHKHMN